MRATATKYKRRGVVCLYAGHDHTRTAEWIEMPFGADSRGLKETKQVLDGGPRFKRGKEAMNPQTWPQITPGEAGRLVPLECKKTF